MRDVLVAKATENADFRAALLADPKAVINKEFDIDLPDTIEIKVHESDLSTYHLSLPPKELTEAQLQKVVRSDIYCYTIYPIYHEADTLK